ncbi:MAG: hypothetical protein QY326_07300 [Bdellovibrionota bacterium]|nr:MAG: hypothetical protein QY326_07300 [Bdellovibrionota bacterium]
MDEFWERVQDFIVLMIKVFVILVVLRTALFLFGFRFYMPIVDEFLNWLFRLLGITLYL